MYTKTIALLCTSDNIGGMERVVCNLARRFSDDKIPVRAVYPATSKVHELLKWCDAQGVKVEANAAVLEGDAKHSLTSIPKLAGFLRSMNAGVVNFHYGSNFVSIKDIMAAKLGGVGSIYVTLHSAEGWDRLGEQKRKITQAAASQVTKFIAISKATRRLLLDAGVPDEKIEVIYCGVRMPAATSREAGRKRFSIPEDAFVVAVAARLTPEKGVLDLVQACARVIEGRPNLLLLVAGDGTERLPLEKEARSLLGAQVMFLGQVTDRIEDVYASADVFALPSRLEGLPLVYVEAALQGVPSIASDVGGTREVVVDGETGLVVPAGKVDQFAKAIRSLYISDTLRKTLGDQARARALELFTEDTMYSEYGNLFGTRVEIKEKSRLDGII